MVTYEYISLEDVLYKIAIQAKKGIEYCKKNIPSYYSDSQLLFYYLQAITVYQDDPEETELIQDAKNLFENNYWGVPGMGDCDCFTVLAISSLLTRGYKITDLEIVLGGRKPDEPVHIYLRVKGKNFDLTEPIFNTERNYKYLQTINLIELWPK